MRQCKKIELTRDSNIDLLKANLCKENNTVVCMCCFEVIYTVMVITLSRCIRGNFYDFTKVTFAICVWPIAHRQQGRVVLLFL